MQIQGKKTEFFEEILGQASAFAQEERDKLNTYVEQYESSKKIKGGNDARTTRKITYEIIESQVSSQLPSPKVTPKMWSERHERNAQSIERLCANILDELPFEQLNDTDERNTYIYGGSVWLVEWDNGVKTHSTVGAPKVSVMPPREFIGQPYVYNPQEMDYMFFILDSTRDAVERKYGVKIDVDEEYENENRSEETITVNVCFYKNEDGDVCQFVWSGSKVLLDIDDYYSRKIYVCKHCGKRKELCECDKHDFEMQNDAEERVGRPILLSDCETAIMPESDVIKDGEVVTETVEMPALDEYGQIIIDDVGGIEVPRTISVEVPKKEPTILPYYKPKKYPIVIRRNTPKEKSCWGRSDCEVVKDQQDRVNKYESRIDEKLLQGGVFPIVPENCVAGLDNSVFKKVFVARNAAERSLFGTVDLRADISGDIAAADRAYEQAKKTVGITESYQGNADYSAQSGIAKQLQVAQSAGRLESKRNNKRWAYSELYEILFQLHLAYADEPRPAPYKDEQGRSQNSIFNKYDFIERGENGEYYYDDGYMFSADNSADAERSREFLWQEIRQNFSMGAFGDPQDPETLLVYWQNMERAHYPYARENVVRIEKRIEEIKMAQQAQSEVQL